MDKEQLAQKMRNAKTLESMLLQTYHEQELLIRAIRKSNEHAKIDPLHALLDACYVYDLSEGQVNV